ncbi:MULTISPECIES: epoxyqueuosine reductase [Clostridium]|uniref:Epoxyqueuosine reductase n=1 Tax=Clostridium beijerinckii TaxID=1520 RepID=A0AAW3W9F2_CLOBE|nr:4Fe-4S double cluster binding domain-containing protein [Clostridium beijerinckii]ALB45223.1 epoxyqueuosine reductase [Clostridium beijerinckii NRRL B-598]MBC2457886.1 epoxyqueuosine reductase [Clostridium beijerinckii]MBC2475113.1 epoxyqueuosine reductase [Clostridium beijerinckii]NOV61195.1 epoxyqueuosine reductase [Clostridium beijerinckii]NOV69312.1 epoxyqueuosine reductase [Clostridium beijerinckii]
MTLLADKIKSAALNLGYEKCGIIKISDIDGYKERLDERVERVPESKGFYQGQYRFTQLQDTYPWAKSIVICVRRYGKYHIPEHLKGMIAKYYLVDARKDKNSKDFQDSVKFEEYMQELGLRAETERGFGLVPLRFAAMKAGLGIVRKNNFFYTENGSSVYLDAWLIDKELEAVEIPNVRPCSDKCNLCIKACPSASLSKPYTMNPIACVSCITTFMGRDMTNEKYREEIGNWVYGCDACQDACPMNKNRWQETEEFPNLQELSEHISLEKIIKMDYKFLEEVMQPKFWYIDKSSVWKWKVNAINVMVNDYKEQYKEHILYACNDSNPKVREMAEWAIEKLNLK